MIVWIMQIGLAPERGAGANQNAWWHHETLSYFQILYPFIKQAQAMYYFQQWKVCWLLFASLQYRWKPLLKVM